MEKEKYHILIADDEPIERMVISRIIQGFFGDEVELHQAENGREAIGLFRKYHCQVALLDIAMPGIDGLEAAETIRKENSRCSIIFLTAYDEFDFARRAIRVRALEYLLKPSKKEEIIAVLEEAIYLSGCSLLQPKEEKEETTNLLGGQSFGNPEVQEKREQAKNQMMMEIIREYMEAHYMEDISLQDAAAQLHYSDAYFCKFFKQNFNQNFIMYLSGLRVEKAKELLEDITVNVKDISQRVGFRDSSYFTKVFKRHVGITPSEYRYKRLQL